MSDLNLNNSDEDCLRRRCIIRDSETGNKYVVCEILNADVLPSCMESEPISLQMAAFPLEFEYFKDEDAFIKKGIENTGNPDFNMQIGKMLPVGLSDNQYSDEKANYLKAGPSNCPTIIAGKVKRVKKGFVQLDDKKYIGYVGTIVDTEFGELEIVHSIPQLDEQEIFEIAPGNIILGQFVLSADAAIYDYENGAVFDEEHNLKALKHILALRDAQHCENLFSDDIQYYSEANGATFKGKAEVIEKLKYIFNNITVECYPWMGKSPKATKATEFIPAFPEGKLFLGLAYDKPRRFESICFIENDDNGKIRNMYIASIDPIDFDVDQIL